MPKAVSRFTSFLTILILFQLVSAVPDLLTRPAYGVGTLIGFVIWASLGVAAVRGSEGARKVLVFLTCLGIGASALAIVGGLVVLAGTKDPIALVLMAFASVKLFVCLGFVLSATHEDFRSWVVHKAIERANAKLALA